MLGLLLLALLVTCGCRQDMHDQPKLQPLESSNFFEDGRASRPLLAGTVARGQLRDDEHFYTGMIGGKPVTTFPFPLTADTLKRGQQRYNIYCSPCHDRSGNGVGIVVTRGYRQPPAFHIDRLREAEVGYLFDVITNGFGAMPDYSMQVEPEDRWAIVAYLRVLQRSSRGTLADVPPAERAKLEGSARR